MRHLRAVTGAIADEAGATAIEYALIVALISIASLTLYGLIGSGLSSALNAVASAL